MMKALLIDLARYIAAGFTFRNDEHAAMMAALQARADAAVTNAQRLQDAADNEERELTDDEIVQFDAFNATASAALDSIERRNASQLLNARLQAPVATVSDAGGVEIGNARVIELPGQTRGNHGFRNMGEFASQVFLASKAIRQGSGQIDTRLTNVTTVSTEGTDADGGFAVPPDFREEIQIKVFGEDTLFGNTDSYDTLRNQITWPKDQTTPWNTTGIQCRTKAEAAQATQDKVVLDDHVIALHNYIVLAPVSDELLDDAPAIGSYLQRKAPDVIDFKLTDHLMNGTGTGQMEGVLTSAAGIEVAKEAAQPADTIVFENTVNMLGRLPQRFWRGARWQAPQTALPQLLSMEFPGDSSPVFLMGGNAAGVPFGTLWGLPLMFTEAAPALGDAGDLSLVGWNQYSTGKKVGGVNFAVSMHLFFDWMATAFRFNLRVGGLNWLDAAYTGNDGSTTYSNIIKLAERA